MTRKKPGLKSRLLRLRSEIANAAAEVHYEWDQDEHGVCEWRGTGGICDDVADAIGGVLARHGIDSTNGGQEGDAHAYLIAYDDAEAFEVDIAPEVYETGAGYSWRKRKDAKFRADVVAIVSVPRVGLYIEGEDEDIRDNPTDLVPWFPSASG